MRETHTPSPCKRPHFGTGGAAHVLKHCGQSFLDGFVILSHAVNKVPDWKWVLPHALEQVVDATSELSHLLQPEEIKDVLVFLAETPVLVHETGLHKLSGSDVLLSRMRLAKPTCRKLCRKAQHIQILQFVAEGILLYIYQFVVLSVWQTELLEVTLPDGVRLVGTNLVIAHLLQHGAGGLTHSLNHLLRCIIKTAVIDGNIKPVVGFQGSQPHFNALPLPLDKTTDMVEEIEELAKGKLALLPNPEVYIILDSKSKSKKTTWQSLVSLDKPKAAVRNRPV